MINLEACNSRLSRIYNMGSNQFSDVEKMVRKSLLRQKMKFPGNSNAYSRELQDLDILKNLKGKFPSDSAQIARLDTATKAKLLKKELKKTFPTGIFNVRTSRYSMGSSIDVEYADGVSPKKVKPIVAKYSHDFGSDSQTDYFNVSNYTDVRRKLTPKAKQRKDALKLLIKKAYEETGGTQGIDEDQIDSAVRQKFDDVDLPFTDPKLANY